MPLEVKYNPKEKVVESIFSGEVSGQELEQEAYQTIELSRKHDTSLFLCNGKDAIVNESILKVFELEEINQEENLDRFAKIAIIAPESPNTFDFAKFYEMACLNRGWNVSVFSDRESAVSWLIG